MRFIDRVRICVRAGDGGDGAVAWRREAHVPKGGPAGGDGGRGGNVFLVADDSYTTLLDLKYRQHHRAPSGRPGGIKGMNGRGGEDLFIKVPVGTSVYYEGPAGEPGDPPPWQEDSRSVDEGGVENIFVLPDEEDDVEVAAGDPASAPREATTDSELFDAASGEFDAEAEAEALFAAATQPLAQSPVLEAPDLDPLDLDTGDLMGDLTTEGATLLVGRGGQGGRGNIHFKTSTNRAPDRAEPGSDGDALWIRLELRLLADVGIVGFPNVGKSTLIRKISRARPEVGDYPFTTLVPQLGVVSLGPDRVMVVADVPGLVRGASEGRGLGHQFLRHLERTRVLLHLLAPDPDDTRSPLADLDALESELRRYDADGALFEGRPRVVALNKMDTPEGEALLQDLKRRLRERNIPVFPISAHTGEGIDKLLEALWRRLELAAAPSSAR